MTWLISFFSWSFPYGYQQTKQTFLHFSFGQTALFLLGGKTTLEDPIALYIRSGDIVIMSEDTRLRYHAIPKIFEPTEQCQLPKGLTLPPKENRPEPNEKPSEHCQTCRNDDDICNYCRLEIQILKELKDMDWECYVEYMQRSRINMNVRQVYPKNSESKEIS